MVRTYQRKSTIGMTDKETMLNAVQSHFNGGLSIKRAAESYGIARTTLTRYIKKCKDKNIDWDHVSLLDVPTMCPNYKVRQVFSQAEESLLCDYLLQCSRLHHGLPPLEARKVAYEFAVANNKNIPRSWTENKCSGKDWFTSFLKRNKNLSLRTPESTSLARAMGFNKPIVMKFFDNLEALMDKYQFGPHQIYNMDETGLTTVQQPSKVVGEKGVKQIGQITSAEKGTLVTVCCAVNAVGNAIPPLMIFPRVHFKLHMTKGAPPATEGRATPSGWISNETFLDWMKHFIRFANPTKETPLLLLMDNHETHTG